jgi:hypothetical protein
LVGIAASASSVASGASIQATLNRDGSGMMIANSQTNPEGETWAWESCTPSLTACRPSGQGRSIDTYGFDRKVVFRATSSLGASAESRTWLGNVKPENSPSAVGRLQANELVTPIPGRWRGGWTGDLDWTQLAACPAPSDARCTTLTDLHYTEGCPNGAAVIDPKFTGEYLRVADQRVSSETLVLDYGLSSPYGQEVWKAGPTISVKYLGRIAPAVRETAAACGPEALVEASIAEGGVATVRCGLGCDAVLIFTQGRHRARVSRTLDPLPYMPTRTGAIPRLRIPSQRLADFREGYAKATVTVDRKRAAQRAIWLVP